MLDGVLFLLLIGFLGFLVWSTVFGQKTPGLEAKKTPPASLPPAAVSLYCEICGEHAGVISTEAYKLLEPPVYCGSCKFVIERYKTRT